MSQLSEQLDTLVRQIESYEENPKALDSTNFLTILSNLIYNFELIRKDDERKAEVDQRLYHHTCSKKLDTSNLRFLAIHLLATSFEFYANRSGEHDKAYNEARLFRGDATADAPFVQAVLLPKLFDPVNLVVPADVRFQLLCKLAQLQNDGNDTPIFEDSTPLPQITRMTKEMFALGLVRRWLKNEKANLSQDARRVENKLYHNKTFDRVAHFDDLMGEILGKGFLNYLVPDPWYKILGRALANFFRKLWASLLNIPYVFGRARPSFYLALGLLAIALAVLTTVVAFKRENALSQDLYHALGERKGGTGSHGSP